MPDLLRGSKSILRLSQTGCKLLAEFEAIQEAIFKLRQTQAYRKNEPQHGKRMRALIRQRTTIVRQIDKHVARQGHIGTRNARECSEHLVETACAEVVGPRSLEALGQLAMKESHESTPPCAPEHRGFSACSLTESDALCISLAPAAPRQSSRLIQVRDHFKAIMPQLEASFGLATACDVVASASRLAEKSELLCIVDSLDEHLVAAALLSLACSLASSDEVRKYLQQHLIKVARAPLMALESRIMQSLFQA